MNYRQLQTTLKSLKAQELTNIKLNSCETLLRSEYERLVATGEMTAVEDCQASISALRSPSEATESKGSASPATSNRKLFGCKEEIELDPEIEAFVAKNWTDNPELAIATAAAYTVASFAMVVLWIALITTALVITALKCWHWCRKGLADLTLQLKYCEPLFEFPALTKSQIEHSASVKTLLVH